VIRYKNIKIGGNGDLDGFYRGIQRGAGPVQQISVISQINGISLPALYRQEKFHVTEGITGKSDTW